MCGISMAPFLSLNGLLICTTTNKQIVKWQKNNRLEADFIDQPERPSRALTMEEKSEASCLVNLGRAKAMKDTLVKEMEAAEAEDEGDVYGGPRDLEAGFKKVV